MKVYFDNAATTPLLPEVRQSMMPFLEEHHGNASSLHGYGVRAARAVEQARSILAAAMGADPDEVVFTSGGTESNNAALKGVLLAGGQGGHLIVSGIEHPSVRATAAWLAGWGVAVTTLPVDGEGFVDPDDLLRALRPDTRLVSIMTGNNEFGTVQDLEALGRVCASQGVPFHTDACQGFTPSCVDVRKQALSLVTLNAHKLHGPKGVGALILRRHVPFVPWLHGGHQEQGRRAGTHDTPAIVGFGKAVELSLCADLSATASIRDRLIQGLERIPGATLLGSRQHRLPGNVCLRFHGVAGKAVFNALSERGIAVSTGSACRSGDLAPNPVLLALGLDTAAAHETVRFTLGRQNTAEEVDFVAEQVAAVVTLIRQGVA